MSNPDTWCPGCEKGVPSDHDSAWCNNCGELFCENRGDVMLGICRDCAKALAKKQE